MRKLKKIIRLLIILACLAYLVKFFYSDRQSLKLVLKLDWLPISYISALTAIYFLVLNFRLKIVFEKCSGLTLPFWPVFKILTVANFLNMIISQAGNIYRAASLKKIFNVSYTRYISSLTSLLWMDTCLNMFIAVIVMLLVKSDFPIGKFTAWKLFLTMGLVITAVPIAGNLLLSLIKTENRYLSWIHSKLSEVLSVTINNLKDLRYIIKTIILGFLILLLIIAGNYILFRGFGIILTIPALLVFYVLLRLSTFITITPGNIGIQEIAYGLVGQLIGTGMAEGILASVVARIIFSIITILLGLLFGGAHLLRQRKDYLSNQD